MKAAAFLLSLCAACGVAPQPQSARTTAAYEVPLPTPQDRADFLTIYREVAQANGFHVDAATPEELNEVYHLTMNATVWRGENDDEVVASAMDLQTNLGKVWVSFAEGTDRKSFAAFRDQLMSKLRARWPQTALLPIMPTGAIPLPQDMVRTADGYRVKPEDAVKYNDVDGQAAAVRQKGH